MIARGLPLHTPRAVAQALRAHGWDDDRAEQAAAGLGPWALELQGVAESALQSLVRQGPRLGLEVLTGGDWAILAGTVTRFGTLARPRELPPELMDVAAAIGAALPAAPPALWETSRGSVSLERPVVAGILNVTPDSFSDGGKFDQLDAALAQADRLVAEGAAIIDIGGESTRPGRPEPVPLEDEVKRVIPVVDALARRHPSVALSVDTVKAEVARRALDAGAGILNDVSGLRLDPAMAKVASAAGAGVILMHSRGDTTSMATLDQARYERGVVEEVLEELRMAVAAAVEAGIPPERIVIDPGFGFAKSAEHNLLLCDRLEALLALGRAIMVGPSRKRFLGSVTGREVPDRDPATAAACVMAYTRGARLFRVHNVGMTRDALAVAHAIEGDPR